MNIVILQNGGFRRDYVGIYIDGTMWWQDNDYGEEYVERLLKLLQMPGEKHVTVETVDDGVAEWMGLSKIYPDTLDEWRQVVTVVTTGRA